MGGVVVMEEVVRQDQRESLHPYLLEQGFPIFLSGPPTTPSDELNYLFIDTTHHEHIHLN